jgi:O-6-methylguanine DNA methyltransferase
MDTQSFKMRVLALVRGIPQGSTRTYKEIALLAGSPRAFRAVGQILKRNYDPTIPCHRVIRSDGTLAGYNRGGSERKYTLLLQEGALKK